MMTVSSPSTEEEISILCSLNDADSYEAPDILKSEKANPPASIPLSQYDHDFSLDLDDSRSLSADDTIPSNDHYEAIGDWPRRLLHVDSMTSFKWRPGNRYGDYVQPQYNAVSYTWGRFDLDLPGRKKVKTFRNVKAIKIDGIDWHVPRISPEHFSESCFRHLIRRTCEPVNEADRRIEFLWLDVACIDQNNGPEKMAEIGRQAVIFQGARRVYIWLTKLHRDRFSNAVRELSRSTHAAVTYEEKKSHGLDTINLIGWLADARSSLDYLFIDPWFTSLWTLQEAFLCQHAYILPLEADLSPIGHESDSETSSPPTLQAFCTMSTLLNQVIESERPIVQAQWQTDKANPDTCKRLKYLEDVYGMLNRRGLLALATRNPIALYNISQYRTTLKDRDRVYGIQQVFDFRLGESAPGALKFKPQAYNRFVLEDQLGAAILAKYAVASQLHVFTEPVEEGRGWRVGASSIIPKLGIRRSLWDLAFEPHCHMSTEKIQGQTRGAFRGRSCDFSELSRAWQHAHTSLPDILGLQSPQQILLDTLLQKITDERLKDHPEEPIWTAVWSKRKEIPRNEQQHRLAWGLNALIPSEFEGESPIVLLLGSFDDSSQDEQTVEVSARYHVGLILVRTMGASNPYWKRLGFCIWQYEYGVRNIGSDGSPDIALMRAGTNCTGWEPFSGLFG